MVRLSNEWLAATIDPKGAELQSLFRKDFGLEYLWKGDPRYWGKHSPVLFPIVGALRDNTYSFKGISYAMSRHGFARDKTFEHTGGGVFALKDDESTRSAYPFSFELSISYALDGPVLTTRYDVMNPGGETLYFSIGGHPAFAAPEPYGDHYLEFSEAETASRRVLTDGLLSESLTPFLDNERRVPLTHELFAQDAIVLHGLRSRNLDLRSTGSAHGLSFHIGEWPDLGIWAAPEAPFVCIEPWQGHADFVDHNYELTQKAGIVALDPGATWSRSWSVRTF